MLRTAWRKLKLCMTTNTPHPIDVLIKLCEVFLLQKSSQIKICIIEKEVKKSKSTNRIQLHRRQMFWNGQGVYVSWLLDERKNVHAVYTTCTIWLDNCVLINNNKPKTTKKWKPQCVFLAASNNKRIFNYLCCVVAFPIVNVAHPSLTHIFFPLWFPNWQKSEWFQLS